MQTRFLILHPESDALFEQIIDAKNPNPPNLDHVDDVTGHPMYEEIWKDANGDKEMVDFKKVNAQNALLANGPITIHHVFKNDTIIASTFWKFEAGNIKGWLENKNKEAGNIFHIKSSPLSKWKGR
jgi:hypothetical protein